MATQVHLPSQKGGRGSSGFIEVEDFKDLAKKLRDGTGEGRGRAIWTDLRHELKHIADEVIVPRARANASWSSRIPATIRSSATLQGVSIRAGGKAAPHAVPYEVGSQNARAGYFRHPSSTRNMERVTFHDVWTGKSRSNWVHRDALLGDRYTHMQRKIGNKRVSFIRGAGLHATDAEAQWTEIETRPYLGPALLETAGETERRMVPVVDRFFRRAGFR